MDFSQLTSLTLSELNEIAGMMDLHQRRSKADVISSILECFKVYEAYKKDKIDRYTRIEQLGNKGKEGLTFLVKTKRDKEYAMKTFRSNKSSANIMKEVDLQKKASSVGISPSIIDFDTVGKYIVMDKLGSHLFSKLSENGGKLTRKEQTQIFNLFKGLDEAEVFHADANLMNYMYDENGNLKIIDFGMSKPFSEELFKELGTRTPNQKIMLLGFILKLKNLGAPESSFSFLKTKLSKEDLEKFDL